MQTHLAEFIRDTPEGREAEAILRKCVHCGFCTATCPTYQLLGDELDGPRGRIYLIKQVLEGATPTARTQLHLDRCLTCRACETTCPSGVQYGRLVDIGREVVSRQVRRGMADALQRRLLRGVLSRPGLAGPAMRAGRMLRPLLPSALADKLPPAAHRGHWPGRGHDRRMLALAGCVQPALAPDINAATARVLDAIGIALEEVPEAGCCGALRFHLDDHDGGRAAARRNIDAWWPHVEQGIEAIVMTASGCGAFVREYGHLLKDDPEYADRAALVAELTRDIAEILAEERKRLSPLLEAVRPPEPEPLAFHLPCSLQHAQGIRGVVEGLLTEAGYELTPVADGHLCCGSAGTYSVTQPELATRLRDNKLAALRAGGAPMIATANIGCLTHLQSGTKTPVRHWIELVAGRLV
ncbi:MAG: glycolate oxidase subunit GlcF [Betaproteobacteria bacterium]|nr:glycolate oxidase subunit GlcF [Betaproteobacteria bacterium]